MKHLIILCALFASCSTMRKTVTQQKQDVNKSTFFLRDSIGSLSIDTSSEKSSIEWGTIAVDSNYDKVTEEEIKEVIDSGIIRRETKRTIKEKGQKRVEQSSVIIQKDSSGKQINQQATVMQVQKNDSSAVTVTHNKQVKRTSFLPWWIWLIAGIAGVVAWWKRNSIIDFFT